ncbi:MAG: NAD(P)H-hydrate dehydratase [Cryobacterium sp.]|nr:NAD(P)H-hydrate dehydratase [Cryobacterium sp.]
MVHYRQSANAEFREWTIQEASDWIAVPSPQDDKYSRGVLGVVTGSTEYPGAAVIGVDAALHTGVGMVRYLGGAASAVLARRPEAVASAGHVDAWLLGSGMTELDETSAAAIADGKPTVLDAGALPFAATAHGATVLTPHAGELARILGVDRAEVEADRAASVLRAVDELAVTVMLKGHETLVADPHGSRWKVTAESSWLATAGTGDSLAGILGALVATHAGAVESDPPALAALAATASRVHVTAAEVVGGPFTVLALGAAIPAAVRRILAGA